FVPGVGDDLAVHRIQHTARLDTTSLSALSRPPGGDVSTNEFCALLCRLLDSIPSVVPKLIDLGLEPRHDDSAVVNGSHQTCPSPFREHSNVREADIEPWRSLVTVKMNS